VAGIPYRKVHFGSANIKNKLDISYVWRLLGAIFEELLAVFATFSQKRRKKRGVPPYGNAESGFSVLRLRSDYKTGIGRATMLSYTRLTMRTPNDHHTNFKK